MHEFNAHSSDEFNVHCSRIVLNSFIHIELCTSVYTVMVLLVFINCRQFEYQDWTHAVYFSNPSSEIWCAISFKSVPHMRHWATTAATIMTAVACRFYPQFNSSICFTSFVYLLCDSFFHRIKFFYSWCEPYLKVTF